MSERRILIVEDNLDLVEIYSTFLKNDGYIVETVNEGIQAIEKTQKTTFDLVILDINLPDIMGDKVAIKLREINENIIIIMITGFPSLQDSIDILDVGIYDILLKPITTDELLRVIREALSTQSVS
jgi:DNA-binding response OmpR family regulator